MKPIEQIAEECGAEFTPAYSETTSSKDTIVFFAENMEALRQAIIKDFVGGLTPLYYDKDYDQPVYSLEEWK